MEENKTQTLYNLELHEGITTEFGIFIMRVPGGWIYDCWDKEADKFKTGVFVPFNNEFQETKHFDTNDLF